MTLEQQLFALLEQHDLSSLSLQVHRGPNGEPYLYSYAHGEDAKGKRQLGSTEYDSQGAVASAIGSAIAQLNIRRYPPVVAVEALQPMEMAA